jgi:hypothetical protein
MKKFICLILSAFIFLPFAYSQNYGKGAVLDKKHYESLTRKAVQVSRAYESLPKAVSLKGYAPNAGNQGMYGTCTAWSSAYGARTISESLALNRTNKTIIDKNVFSPVFVYKNISDDPTCSTGTFISDALTLMQNIGVPKMSALEKTEDFKQVPLSVFSNERKFTIAAYTTLYTYSNSDSVISKVDIVKKSLSENKPVVIAIVCPPSFSDASYVWYPTEKPDLNYGGHALCVVGYDDNKEGGAFEILNSWGTHWGNEGYIWINYNTFELFAYEAYELIDNLATYGEMSEYSAYAKIELSNAENGMPVVYKDGFYETINDYPSRTRFRYLLGNDSPSYVYAFASDDTTNKTSMVFPYEGQNISPVLDYRGNLIAFPSEKKWIQLDNTKGTDYLIVLYSKEALDIDAIRKKFESASGTFPQRVAQSVGKNFIPATQADYSANGLRFSAKSANNKAVLGLLLAIKHR